MAIDGESIKGKAQGLFSGPEGSAAEKTRANQIVVGRVLHIPFETAANTDKTVGLCDLPFAIRVKSAKLVTHSGSQASAAADGWAFTLKYDDGAGGSSTSIASLTVTATAITAGTRRTMTQTAPVAVAASSRLFLVCDATNTAATANALVGCVTLDCEET